MSRWLSWLERREVLVRYLLVFLRVLVLRLQRRFNVRFLSLVMVYMLRIQSVWRLLYIMLGSPGKFLVWAFHLNCRQSFGWSDWLLISLAHRHYVNMPQWLSMGIVLTFTVMTGR